MKKWIVPILLCASFALSSVGLLMQGSPAREFVSEKYAAQTTELDETYKLGQRFTVPELSFATESGNVPASAILISPTGKATVSSTVVLDTAGKWTIRYTANAGGRTYSEEKSFLVLNNAYILSSDLSSASYGNYTQYGCDSEGLLVKLAMNDTLTFEKVIDLDKLKPSDTLVSGFVTPTSRGIADFGRIIFTLTDAEDPSVSMQIMLHRYKNSDTRGLNVSYVMANGNGQYPTGIDAKDGKEYLHVADGIGTPIAHSFVAQNNNDGWSGPAVDIVPDKNAFRLGFDSKEIVLTACGKKVADFDDATYFDELWFGFTSNKVRLTVSASLYNAATANFCLTEVFGIDLTEEFAVDNDAPVITVYVDDKDNMPEAKLGGTYPVPEVSAVDTVSGECETTVKVYCNFMSDKPIAIPVTNGRFSTDRFGDYAIVYTAADRMGNTAQEVLNVHAGNDIPEFTVICPENPSVEVGYEATVNAPTVQGGSGRTSWTATATLDGVTVDATHGFCPQKAGNWTVEYKATDFVGNVKTASCTLEVTAGLKPVLPESVALPPVMIGGAAYTLPAVYAKDYTSGEMKEVLCDVEITDASGNVIATHKAGEAFKPESEMGGDKIYITYKCGAAKTDTVAVPIIRPYTVNASGEETNSINVGAYFYGEGFTAEILGDDGVTVSSDGECDYFAWMFANAQTAENASVVLGNVAGKTDCDSFTVFFTDAGDLNRSVALTVTSLSADKSAITVGERTITLNRSLAGESEVVFTVRYAQRRLWINSTALDTDTDTEGNPFGGFLSDKVYISVIAEGVTTDTQYLVKSINGNAFTLFTYDVGAPKITVLGDYGGTYAVGDKYVIAPATSGDVYCPNVTLTMTVRDPDGNVLTDVNGVTLSQVDASFAHTIELTKLGQYKITYDSSEVEWRNRMGRPNTSSLVLMVNVLDSQAPTVEFKQAFMKTAKAGDVLVIPDFTVSDDITQAENVTVLKYVCNPDGKLIELNGNSVKCEYEGEYEFRIIVRDEAGNTNMYKFTVTVG